VTKCRFFIRIICDPPCIIDVCCYWFLNVISVYGCFLSWSDAVPCPLSHYQKTMEGAWKGVRPHLSPESFVGFFAKPKKNGNRTCLVKRSRNQFGHRCFATAGPTLWNSLPEQLGQPDITFGQFKRSLKTFVFG